MERSRNRGASSKSVLENRKPQLKRCSGILYNFLWFGGRWTVNICVYVCVYKKDLITKIYSFIAKAKNVPFASYTSYIYTAVYPNGLMQKRAQMLNTINSMKLIRILSTTHSTPHKEHRTEVFAFLRVLLFDVVINLRNVLWVYVCVFVTWLQGFLALCTIIFNVQYQKRHLYGLNAKCTYSLATKSFRLWEEKEREKKIGAGLVVLFAEIHGTLIFHRMHPRMQSEWGRTQRVCSAWIDVFIGIYNVNTPSNAMLFMEEKHQQSTHDTSIDKYTCTFNAALSKRV